jgi:hypothetical protein
MARVSYTKPANGETIDPVDVTTPLDTIYNEFNGSIDSTNLADDAVTTAKITNASVTNAKLSTTAGELGGAWLAWTPSWANLTIGSATVDARYMSR